MTGSVRTHNVGRSPGCLAAEASQRDFRESTRPQERPAGPQKCPRNADRRDGGGLGRNRPPRRSTASQTLGKAITMSFIINNLAAKFSTGSRPFGINYLRATSDNAPVCLWKKGATSPVCCNIRFTNIFASDHREPTQSRARFLIQIGVPTKPNAARIWFSKKRW